MASTAASTPLSLSSLTSSSCSSNHHHQLLIDAPPPRHQSLLPPKWLSNSRIAYCKRKFGQNVVAAATMATEEAPTASAEVDVAETTKTTEIIKSLQEAWDKVEDKYAVTSLVVAGGVALWASAGMIYAIDRLPLIPGVFELVGIGYTGWFAYQNLVLTPNREALIQKIKETYKDITGTS